MAVHESIRAKRYRKRRTAKIVRYEAALVVIRDELATSTSDKGKRLHKLAVDALGGE